MNENKKALLPSIFVILLICAFALLGKDTEINKNMFFNNSFIVIPFIFLISGLAMNKLEPNFVKKSHLQAIAMFFLFLLILSVASIFKSNESTYYYRASLEFVFTSENTNILGLSFSYPNLLKLGLFISAYYISQTIFIALIKSLKDAAPKFFSFLISYLISIIIYILIIVGLGNLINILINKINFNQMIINLTSYFIAAFVSCVITSILFLIISNNKKEKNIVIFKNIS